MKYKNLIIYGGTSEISYHLIKLYYDECEKFIIFVQIKTISSTLSGIINLKLILINLIFLKLIF